MEDEVGSGHMTAAPDFIARLEDKVKE